MAPTVNKLQVAETIEEIEGQDYFTVREPEGARDTNIKYGDVIVVVPYHGHNGSRTIKYDLLSLISTEPEPESGGVRSCALQIIRLDALPASFLQRFALSELPRHLSDCLGLEAKRELQVLVSEKSGIGEAKEFFQHVVEGTLAAIGFSPEKYHVHYTTSETSIADYATRTILPRANAGTAQTVLVLSGDGGVIDIIDALFEQEPSQGYVKPTIGLLVLGTGNALANSSGLNVDGTKGLSSFLRGSAKSIPTLSTRFSPGSVLLVDEARATQPLRAANDGVGTVHGAVVTSWGLHASLVADSDTTEYRKHGSQRFAMAAGELLDPSDGSPSHIYQGKVTLYKKNGYGGLESTVWERNEHMYILATLVSNLEAALRISPSSKPLDGQLRLVHFGPLPSAEVKRIFGLAFAGGKHVEDSALGYEDIEGLRIDFQESEDSRWRSICVDGKIVRVPEGGWVEVRREKREVADLVVTAVEDR